VSAAAVVGRRAVLVASVRVGMCRSPPDARFSVTRSVPNGSGRSRPRRRGRVSAVRNALPDGALASLIGRGTGPPRRGTRGAWSGRRRGSRGRRGRASRALPGTRQSVSMPRLGREFQAPAWFRRTWVSCLGTEPHTGRLFQQRGPRPFQARRVVATAEWVRERRVWFRGH
jgi:hypothetical protein